MCQGEISVPRGDTEPQETGVWWEHKMPGLQGSKGLSPWREVRPWSKVQGQFPERRVWRGEQALEPSEKKGGLNPKEENVGSDAEGIRCMRG